MIIFSRILAAIIGGYWVANSTAILLSAILTGSQANRVLTSMLVSFLIYAVAVIWVFSARTAKEAWAGIFIPGAASTVIVFLLLPQSLL